MRAALHPVLSSPRWLSLGGIGIGLVVYVIQLTSGVPAWVSWSPVELSSNVVATMGLAWAALQIRASWRSPSLRRAWLSAMGGMALLSVEGQVGEIFSFETHGPQEMGLSIALWLLAAWLLFRTARRYAMRRSVEAVMHLGLAIQLASQLLGWWNADGHFPDGGTEFFEYLTDMGELAAVLAYVAALLLAVFSPNKSYAFPLSAIGMKGRLIHHDFDLRQAFGPTLRDSMRMVLSGLSGALSVGRSWTRISTQAHRAGGPSPLRQAAELLRCGLLQSIGPKTYYGLGLFLRSGHVDAIMTGAETRNGLTASLQRTRRDAAAPDALLDRVEFARVCRSFDLPFAPILAMAENGAFELRTSAAALDQDLVARDRVRRADELALRFDRLGPSIYRHGDEMLNVEMLASRLAGLSRRAGLVVQPRLRNHPDVAAYAGSSLILFRVVTCLDAAGQPHVTHGVMRVLARDEPGWPQSADSQWGAAIDLVGGRFGPLVGDSAETCLTARPDHPVTRERIEGSACAGWPALAKTAVAAHRAFEGHVLIGWDLAWTPDGPILLQGAANMDFDFIQRCYGVPIGRSPLAPLLDLHLDRIVAERLSQDGARR